MIKVKKKKEKKEKKKEVGSEFLEMKVNWHRTPGNERLIGSSQFPDMRFDQKFLALNHELSALEFDMNLHNYYILLSFILMLSIYLSIHPSIFLFIYLSIYFSIHPSIYLYVFYSYSAGADRD